MDYNNYYNSHDTAAEYPSTNQLNAVMRGVYLKMTLGLLVSAFTAFFAASSSAVVNIFAQHPGFMWVLLIAEVGLVIAISAGLRKMSSGIATLLFYLFAIVNGLALFPIFFAFTEVSIYKTFFITAGVFGAMTVYGYFTTQDLTRWGSFLFMALIGLIIVSIVNWFLHSSGLQWIISGAGVLIFIGLTAWDTQTIKRMALAAPADSLGKVATIGALNLYLDFINLFLYLLRFFGNRD